MIIDTQFAVELLRGIPPEIATVIIATTPIFELRGSLPVAMTVYNMNIPNAYFWSVVGNAIPVVIIMLLLDPVSTWLSKHFSFWNKFFIWLFERTRKRAKSKIEKYGHWGLFFLVAIPLPVTGGWTGAMAAFLFGIKRRKAIPVILLGIMAAGVIVTLITIGAVHL